MKLNLLLRGVCSFTVKGSRYLDIESISYSSKQVKNKGMFFAIRGIIHNGYDFIDEALERGAECVVAEKDFITYKNITKVIVDDTRKACAVIAANFYNHPSDKMNITGITGTNGKTTVLYMVSEILQHAGMQCGMIGTINYKIGPRIMPAANTTPSSIMLQMLMSDMERSGIKDCAIEVSSHALDQNRVDAISFHRAIFTNLTKEHLDYHKNMDRYFHAKRKLFSMLKEGGMGIINIDDPYGRIIADENSGRVLTYGIKNPADITACEIAQSHCHTNFKVCAGNDSFYINSPLIGEYNIYNMLAAIAWSVSMGLSLPLVKAAMQGFRSAPGRMEKIEPAQGGISVFIDYAHTDDALSNVLSTLYKIKQKRIITVFGCGGDRDKAKRPRMAKAAALFSDYVVITSDNPRNEKPEGIVDDIRKGIPREFSDFNIIIDRKKAIEHAIGTAQRGDIVLIAGKGHENYQVLKDTTVAFDDKKVARDALERLYETERV